MDGMPAERDFEWYISPTGPIRRVWENVVNGLIPLSELDDQEISQIRLKASDGRFGGPKPFVTRKMATDFRRELIHRADLKVQGEVMRMFEVLADVATSAESTGSEKTRAAQYLIERGLGKVPDRVEVTAEIRPWEGVVMGILTDVGEVEEEGSDEMKEIEG
jgi:hypothetical protein